MIPHYTLNKLQFLKFYICSVVLQVKYVSFRIQENEFIAMFVNLLSQLAILLFASLKQMTENLLVKIDCNHRSYV